MENGKEEEEAKAFAAQYHQSFIDAICFKMTDAYLDNLVRILPRLDLHSDAFYKLTPKLTTVLWSKMTNEQMQRLTDTVIYCPLQDIRAAFLEPLYLYVDLPQLDGLNVFGRHNFSPDLVKGMFYRLIKVYRTVATKTGNAAWDPDLLGYTFGLLTHETATEFVHLVAKFSEQHSKLAPLWKEFLRCAGNYVKWHSEKYADAVWNTFISAKPNARIRQTRVGLGQLLQVHDDYVAAERAKGPIIYSINGVQHAIVQDMPSPLVEEPVRGQRLPGIEQLRRTYQKLCNEQNK